MKSHQVAFQKERALLTITLNFDFALIYISDIDPGSASVFPHIPVYFVSVSVETIVHEMM